MTLGERIRAEREAKGWSQAELGRILGVAAPTVHRYETNDRRPDPEMLLRLADLFGVSADYLLGRGSSQPEPDPQIRAILRSMKGLTEVERQDVLDYVAWKRAQRHRQQQSKPKESDGEPEPL